MITWRGQIKTRSYGAVAEWLRSGLQSREHRFDSGPRLHPLFPPHQAQIPVLSAGPPTSQPPNLEPPTPAPHRGQIIGEDQQAKGQHPKTQDGKEAKNTPKEQQRADNQAQPPGITADGMLHSLVVVFRHMSAYHESGPQSLGRAQHQKPALFQ